MRTIIHISDIHFGRNDISKVDLLITTFSKIKPHLIIVSGDLTQRATAKQFKSAEQMFKKIEELGFDYFVIPGNHDIVPLYKPLARLVNPYSRYKKHISTILEPTWNDDELAIAGINTVRSSAFKDGRVNVRQIKKVEEWFNEFSDDKLKIIVSHHPFDLPPAKPKRKLARRSKVGMSSFSKSHIDLFLSGHYHHSSVIETTHRYRIDDYSAIAIQAGTMSLRQRGEVQSFNVLRVNKPEITVETYLFNLEKSIFKKASSADFTFKNKVWKQI